jgi:hypothetical protein
VWDYLFAEVPVDKAPPTFPVPIIAIFITIFQGEIQPVPLQPRLSFAVAQ